MSFVTVISLYYIIREKIQSNNKQRRDDNTNKPIKEELNQRKTETNASEISHQLTYSMYWPLGLENVWILTISCCEVVSYVWNEFV